MFNSNSQYSNYRDEQQQLYHNALRIYLILRDDTRSCQIYTFLPLTKDIRAYLAKYKSMLNAGLTSDVKHRDTYKRIYDEGIALYKELQEVKQEFKAEQDEKSAIASRKLTEAIKREFDKLQESK